MTFQRPQEQDPNAWLHWVDSYPVKAAPLDARQNQIRAKLRSLEDVQPVLTSRYLVKGWLDREASSVLYGESNVGKTFFALDLSLHVAAGMDWHGAKIGAASGPVVYVASEGGSGIKNRIAAVRHNSPDLFEAAKGNFYLLAETLDLCTSADAEALANQIVQECGAASLVIVDTLARSMGGGDENSAKDMSLFVRAVDLIRERTKAHVMVIHHSGKESSKGARGSSALRAAVDSEIELTRDGKVIQAETRKQRDMETGKLFAYTLQGVTIGRDEDGEEVTSAIVNPTKPVARKPKLTGQQDIAMQAFGDALAKHGEVKAGDMFPDNRQCITVACWREYCDRHSLSSGEGESSKRTAFHKVKTTLQNKGIVRIVDDYVWRAGE